MLKKDFISKHLCLFPTFPWSPRGIINFNRLKLEILKAGEQAKVCQLTQKAHCSWRLKKNVLSLQSYLNSLSFQVFLWAT